MNRPEFYEEDLLFFFNGRPRELALYEALMGKMEMEVITSAMLSMTALAKPITTDSR